MISEYEAEQPRCGPGNLMLAVTKGLTIRGFRASGLTHLLPGRARTDALNLLGVPDLGGKPKRPDVLT